MIGGVAEIATDGYHLSRYRGFMKVTDGEAEVGRVPLDDISCLLLSAYSLTLSKTLITSLAERGTPIVTLGKNWHPASLTLPSDGHHAQAGILHDQIALTEPRRKRLWQQIVKAKISHQRQVLERHAPTSDKVRELGVLERRVQSGDPTNMEAQAARHYWPALMGDGFRRDTGMPGVNGLLNYGYTVLRAATARAVVGAGLQPALGLHHKSRVNAFALADDLMEPFRPIVDDCVKSLVMDTTDTGPLDRLTPDHKQALVVLLQRDMASDKGASPLINCLNRLAQSLVTALSDRHAPLQIAAMMTGGLFR